MVDDIEFVKKALETAVTTPITDTTTEIQNEFKESFKDIVHLPSYDIIKDYIDLIVSSEKLKSCVLVGENGCGKSTMVVDILKRNGCEFVYFNNYTTALAFYKTCYRHKNKVIVLDDVENVLNDIRGIGILKAITDTKKAIVTYESTSDKMGNTPKSFIFNGKVVILSNYISNSHRLMSLIDRAIFREIVISLDEKKALIKPIAFANYPNLTSDDLQTITAHISTNLHAVTNFTFRTICRICEFYIKNPAKWIQMATDELKPNTKVLLLIELEKKYPSDIQSQIKEWINRSGQSRATFYRIKKSLSQNLTRF